MSGLEVLSIVANILTLVDFSQKILARAAELRGNGEDVREAFVSIDAMLPPISLAVRKTTERIDKGEIDDETVKALVPIHQAVERTLKDLEAILIKYTPEADASKREILWKAAKSVFQEKKLKDVQQKLHEYVGVLTLSHAQALTAGNLSAADKDTIKKFLESRSRSKTLQAALLPRKCRNLLSIDGGGLRGLSILYILHDIMAKVNQYQELPLKPCEVFDLIGGSGTGG